MLVFVDIVVVVSSRTDLPDNVVDVSRCDGAVMRWHDYFATLRGEDVDFVQARQDRM